MKHLAILLGASILGGGLFSSCTYNTYVPPQEVRHVHHYSTSSTSKSASVGGGSGASAEGFQAVTPPHSYSQ